MRLWKRRPSVIERNFDWLLTRGYVVARRLEGMGLIVTYGWDGVLVQVTDDYRDDELLITVARRLADEVSEEPWWAWVHLGELLDRRAPESRDWSARPSGGRGKAIDVALARGAELLETHFADLLEGRNLELLDEIIAARPRDGVPGLDYPTDKPWVASAEGIWFTTDYERLRDMGTYLERSRSDDPAVRALAALKISLIGRATPTRAEESAGHDRLHELLADPDADVRRAAASALGEWEDVHALDALLGLLDDEPGDRMSPIAAAANFLALRGSRDDKERSLAGLGRFASRGAVAAAQVEELGWRLDGNNLSYSYMVWRDPGDKA
jgi:HEAT repeat protein